MKKIIIASAIVIALWILIIKSDLPHKIKKFATIFVIISPIPPIP